MFKLSRFTNCKEASRLLSRAEEQPLSLRDRTRLWLHIRKCVACQRYERQLGLMRQAMRHFRM
jgi:hypothetical protein